MQIPKKVLERSLLLRLGIAMATITLLGVIGMASSIIIAGISQGSAETINIAGSLRMQSYRMLSLTLIAQRSNSADDLRNLDNAIQLFESTLHKPKLLAISVSESRNDMPPLSNYQNIILDWEKNIKPELQTLTQRTHLTPFTRTTHQDIELFNKINAFVEKIDGLVKLLTQQAEDRTLLLSTILGISLFLILIVVFATMYAMYTDVFTPLRDLLTCAEHLGKGDLTVRSQHIGEDELGRLGKAFNSMAEDLSKSHQYLETRINEKTADLERSNRSLELLYHTIARLYDAPVAPDTYITMLTDIEQVLGIGHGLTCLIGINNDKANILASTMKAEQNDLNICAHTDCSTCLSGNSIKVQLHGKHQILKIPLHDMDKQYGVMQLEIPNGNMLEEWQTQLLEALSKHIGIAIGTAHRTEQSRRLSLLEERGVIARELHDSLAQSLSYMKIQVSRLQTNIVQHKDTKDSELILVELREGLNSAYRELRELLTTFRLKIEGDGLIPTLKKFVAEFAARGGITINFNSNITGLNISSNEEIHVMQIVREALSNIIHHAQANNAWVTLEHNAQDMISVTIEDDGIGIIPKPAETHHYGMNIMQERAHTLDGTLHIQPRALGGTCITLRFRSGLRLNPTTLQQGQLTI